MCTSVAVGFYIRGEEEFSEFYNKMMAFKKNENSIFSVYDKKP